VPEHLLLGKGYTLTKEDYDMIGTGTFAGSGAAMDASQEALAISGDYHNGPLSTLMPFGIWGGIGMLWLMGATCFVLYRNYKYGDPELRTFNIYMFASGVTTMFAFFFIFGAFSNDVGGYGQMVGFSLAMNGGLARRPARTVSNPRIKPLPFTAAQPA
jgi:cell division protein FtsW (lipid II flippase)